MEAYVSENSETKLIVFSDKVPSEMGQYRMGRTTVRVTKGDEVEPQEQENIPEMYPFETGWYGTNSFFR